MRIPKDIALAATLDTLGIEIPDIVLEQPWTVELDRSLRVIKAVVAKIAGALPHAPALGSLLV